MMVPLIIILFFSTVNAYDFTNESCTDDFNQLMSSLLNPLNLLEKLIVYPDDLEYILFTRNYPIEEIPINATTKYLINPNLETKIIIPGWLQGYNTTWAIELRDVYLQKKPYNIIIFKWDEYSTMHYYLSTELGFELGNNLGDFIADLTKSIDFNLNKIHIIGHSLGAQIAGFAGQRIMKLLRKRIARITSLDAAGPIFNINTESYRLDKNDAEFVDAYHTNDFLFGYYGPMGTVDVFVNNGIFQPGCPTINDITKPNVTCIELHTFLFCSHVKSTEVWKRSVNNDLIARHIVTGYPIVVGENTDIRSSGFYYLKMQFE